jgi:hypothetical protein
MADWRRSSQPLTRNGKKPPNSSGMRLRMIS